MLHLRKLRQERNLTQLELSKMLQISASAIGMYEQGRREPDHDTLAKIADFFNVSTDYLLGRTDYRKSFTHGLLGKPEKLIETAQQSIAAQQLNFNPPPNYYNDPETQRRMEEMYSDPKRMRIFVASKDLKPEELDRIADLMETIAQSRRKD